jgi:hypothetical protein
MRDLLQTNGPWREETMTFTNVALSLILGAILVLIPCGCILTRSSDKGPNKPAAH